MISSSAARCTIALTARLPRPTRHIVLNLSARNVSMAASMEEVSPVEAHKLTFGGVRCDDVNNRVIALYKRIGAY